MMHGREFAHLHDNINELQMLGFTIFEIARIINSVHEIFIDTAVKSPRAACDGQSLLVDGHKIC
jgi:hypothetical protein